ncbi:hypothetical protein [Escherichia coli]|uniref:hypothetical protein n=1 Tax=Escherichia coli TaxID=562 RepID=UPI0037DCC913
MNSAGVLRCAPAGGSRSLTHLSAENGRRSSASGFSRGSTPLRWQCGCVELAAGAASPGLCRQCARKPLAADAPDVCIGFLQPRTEDLGQEPARLRCHLHAPSAGR